MNFTGVLLSLIIIVGLVVGIGVYFFASTKEIVSKKRIEPELRLTIIDNKVDTVYVYKKQ